MNNRIRVSRFGAITLAAMALAFTAGYQARQMERRRQASQAEMAKVTPLTENVQKTTGTNTKSSTNYDHTIKTGETK